jgi:hypothetical protein
MLATAPVLATSESRLSLTWLRLDYSTGGSQGTRGIRIASYNYDHSFLTYTDGPVILEDKDSNTPSLEVAAVSTSVDAGIGSTFKPVEQNNPPSHEPWYDVEDSCYVIEDRLLSSYIGRILLPAFEHSPRYKRRQRQLISILIFSFELILLLWDRIADFLTPLLRPLLHLRKQPPTCPHDHKQPNANWMQNVRPYLLR